MKVKCANCGKNVPFEGDVCPWCKADKSAQKIIKVFGLAGALLVGLAVGAMSSGFLPAFIGGIVGAVVGTVIGAILTRKASHVRNAGNPARRQR